MTTQLRTAQARALLAERGIDAVVDAAGAAGEIAALRVAATDPAANQLAALAQHAQAIRALGFRYVALDIGPAGAESPSD